MNILRIPRPMGTTKLGLDYHQSLGDKKKKRKYIEFILKNFINETLLWPYKEGWIPQPTQNKKKNQAKTKDDIKNNYEVEVKCIKHWDLALALGWSEIKLEEKVQAMLHKMGQIMVEKQGNYNYEYLARVANSRIIKKSLEGLEQVSGWAEEIQAITRHAGYKPGHILATNQAFGNKLTYLKTVSDMLNKVSPQGNQKHTIIGTQNIQNNGLKQGDPGFIPDAKDGQFLTASMAVRLIEESKLNPIPSLENGLIQEIRIKNGLEGSGLVPIKAIPETDMQGTMAYNPKDLIELAHESRRQNELGIVDGIAGIEDDYEVEID